MQVRPVVLGQLQGSIRYYGLDGWNSGTPNCHGRKLHSWANSLDLFLCATDAVTSLIIDAQQDRLTARRRCLQRMFTSDHLS